MLKKRETKVLLALAVLVLVFFGFKQMQAGSNDKVSGWAWSENIGWISFNCTNNNSCAAVNYGVTVDKNGKLSGYAWSENIGWISFQEGDLAGCPTGGNGKAYLDINTYKITGWARILAYKDPGAGGWDGWISLNGANHQLYVNKDDNEFMDWSWGSDVIGWTSFNCKNQGICPASNYKVILSNFPGKPSVKNLRSDDHNPADYCGVTDYAPVRMRWEFVPAAEGMAQSAYRVEIYNRDTGALVDKSCDPDEKCLGNSQSYISTKVAYDKKYKWRIMVWDSSNNVSDWSQYSNFNTIPHPYPNPDFEWFPVKPSADELIQFCSVVGGTCLNNKTTFYDNKPDHRSWEWDFKDGTPFSSLANPTHSFSIPNLAGYEVRLSVIDGDGYGPCSTSGKKVKVNFSTPGFKEVPPPSE
jgi:hypothetical protein